ncbi:unnamed protein product, partial [Rotaria sordida]
MKSLKPATQTGANAFIISTDCHSARFNFTKENIQRVFPNFLAFIALSRFIWTYEITKYSKYGELEWSFIFEDDVNFVEPSKVSLPNYINALQALMYHPEIQFKHGIFYLGICGPTFASDNHTLIIPFSNNSLLSHKGC